MCIYKKMVVLALVFILPGIANGASLNGTDPCICAVTKIIECLPGGDCLEITPEQALIPVFIKVNFKEKKLSSLDKNDPKSSKIGNVTIANGQIMLQGSEENRAWSMVVDQSNGKISASVSGKSHGFILFGKCTPMP